MQVQVRIHAEGALRNQRYAFTDKFTRISELIRHAVGVKLASATSVSTAEGRP